MSLDRLRRNFHTGDIPLPTSACLDAEVVAALAEGSLDPEARARALRHVAGCALCRRAVASVSEALADGPITQEIEIVEGTRRRGRWMRISVPLAAAVVALLLLRSPAGDSSTAHRGGGQDGRPVPLGPMGTVAAARHFDWSRVAGSDAYRLKLFDTHGAVVYEIQVTDTSVTLPDSVRLVDAQLYLWNVDARTGWDRWATSELVTFTIARSPPE